MKSTESGREHGDNRGVVEDAGQFDRRRFLHVGAAGALSLAAGGILAACGSDEDSGGQQKSKATGPPAPVELKAAPTEPFDPNVKPGLKPKLPRRIAWALPASGALMTSFDNSVRAGAKGNDLEYLSAQANGDATKQFQQTEAFLSRGIGALIAIDLAPPALAPIQLRAIKAGIPVFCGPFAVSTTQMTADQSKLGRAAGEAAVTWIKENLGGKARVALFNQDTSPAQKPKAQAVRDALKAGGSGIELVADSTFKTGDADEGFKLSNTILQRHPDVDVWIGWDGPLGGTLAALEAAGKASGNIALFGYGDGDDQALASIVEGGPYKSTQGIVYPPVAYAWSKYASDWLAGKSIPLVMSVEPVALDSKEAIDEFKRLGESPEAAFKENETSHRYFTPLGNTSYENPRYLSVVA